MVFGMPQPPRSTRPWLRLPLLGALTATLGLTAGCASSSRLVASDGSHRLVARDDASGLTVVLTTEAWEGEPYVSQDLTVVHMLVSNLSTQPVLLAPGDFELVDSRGFRYVLRDAGARFREQSRPDLPYDPGQGRDFVGITGGDLSRNALPWGVLQPGTQMRGFVYFESLKDRANHAELIWHAQSPNHQSLVDISFPLSVARTYPGA
jgi:hypothetical protein